MITLLRFDGSAGFYFLWQHAVHIFFRDVFGHLFDVRQQHRDQEQDQQGRKAQAAVEHFDYVHSVDRLKIARRLSRFAQEAGLTLPVLLECNVSGEGSKFGFDLEGWEHDEAQRGAFFAAVEEILELPGLAVRGLMTMAPFVADPETVRPVFASLSRLFDALQERFPSGDWLIVFATQ